MGAKHQYIIQVGWIITHCDNRFVIYHLWHYVNEGKCMTVGYVTEAYLSTYIYETVKVVLKVYLVYLMILTAS